jgi:hypothetical protein
LGNIYWAISVSVLETTAKSMNACGAASRKLLARGSHDKKSASGTTNMAGISFVTASH